ncbi:MAG: FAD-dependent oxidoreductase [Litoreibacter sp.]
MKFDTDILVVGGGIIGLMAASYAAKNGKSVMLMEKHFPGTQEGSSAGHARMWRTMYSEPEASELSYMAGDLYRDIENETGTEILDRRGLLFFGAHTDYTPEGTLLASLETLKNLGKPYEILNKKQMEERYPFKNLPDHYLGIFQKDNAVIDVKSAINAGLALCERDGVVISSGAKVIRIESNPGHVIAYTEDGKKTVARKAIVAPGPYVNELLQPNFGFSLNLTMWDMSNAFYRIKDDQREFPMWYQFDQPDNGYSNLFYGFPPCSFSRPGFVQLGVVWASHQFTDVSQRNYAPAKIDLEIVRDFVKRRMKGLDSAPIDATRALAVLLPDHGCILDYLPSSVANNTNVVVCAGGWAFKFAPLFGKLCAELALEQEPSVDISNFSIERPGRIATKAVEVDMRHFAATAAE